MKALGTLFRTGLWAFVSIALASCGGGGGGDGGTSASVGSGAGSGPGALHVSLTDAPACGYDHVFVTVSKVSVHTSASAAEDAAGWADIVVSPAQRVDLLTLTNGVLFDLGQTALPSGRYQQMRLVLAANGKSPPYANSVVPAGGDEVALDTPSAQQSGLKMQVGIDVPAGKTMDVAIDFDACKSVVKAGNSGKYLLKPVLTVIPLVSVGAIGGYVSPPVPATPVNVSAQVGGTVVKSTVAGADGHFRLSPLPVGPYDVVVTASGRTSYAVTGVPVVTGGETLLTSPPGLILAPSFTGQAAGVVTPVAASALVRALQAVSAASRVETGFVNADSTTGGYSLFLPLERIEVAPWVAPIPPATVPVLVFAPFGTGGAYTLEASATGYLTQSAGVAVSLGTIATRNFALVPAP